ncbi:sensor histidine kinase [Paenibacillus sediminis]|uniref:Two-component system sensor histidine kinase YesM n=1 Tax=Paenibacillus sediminis TaxID=664909 RepID=A0ABS4H7P2_9BACL|nr:sensor histidine kinase [Paenibacillus sediminis]MBP1938535.1 two-component system sensor histidine kinase YesM [Paenibacillus sediminis]
MRFQSIRSKLIMFMLIATTIPLLLSITITYIHTRESIKEQAIQENTRLIFQGKTNLENYLKSINQASILVYSDPHFLNNLTKIPDDYRAVAEVYTTLKSIQSSVADIDQVYLHANNTEQSTLVTRSVTKRETRSHAYIGKGISWENGDTQIEATHPMHGYGFQGAADNNKSVITLYRSITRIPTTKQLGVLAIDVGLDSIATISGQLYDANKEKLMLLDEKGTVIYSGDSELVGKRLPDKWTLDKLSTGQQKGHFEGNNSIYIYEKINMGYAKWTVMKQIPNHTLFERATELTQINMAITVIALLLIILGTLFISIRITEPIKQLTRYMNRIQSGHLEVDIEVTSKDEIGVLFRRFRQMMDTINNLILREYRLEIANKTNELKALQAQINPHFLYNTLQSIGTLALQHNVPRIYSLLSSLAKMMRYSMRNNDTLVTLQDEVNYINSYIELQKERFGDGFEAEIHIDPNTLKAHIPKMILQPLVENYFKHGMNPQLGKGHLNITSTLTGDGNRLRITVKNDGSSIPEDKLSKLQDALQQQMAGHTQETADEDEPIGIRNVLMRLRLYTDDTAILTLNNMKPHGIMVTLEFNLLGSDNR